MTTEDEGLKLLVDHMAERLIDLEGRMATHREIDALRADLQREADKSDGDITHGLNALREKVMKLFYGLIGLAFGVLGVLLKILLEHGFPLP